MITMSEARKKAYNIFPKTLEPESLSRQVNIVKYIEHLGSVTSTPIDEWPITQVFTNPETKLLYTERSRINQLFFEFKEKDPGVTKAETTATVADDVLQNIISDFGYAAVNIAYEVREGYEIRVRDYSKEVMKHQALLLKAELALHGLEQIRREGYEGIKKSLADLLSQGFYTLHTIPQTNIIVLKTRPITLSCYNKAQAIENVVPMGEFFVEIKTRGDGILWVQVYPAGKNPNAGESYYHPHVLRSEVCYGNLLAEYNTAAAKFDIAKVARLTQEVLDSYNDGNPHQRLYKFEEAWKANRFQTPRVYENADEELEEEEGDEPEEEGDEPEEEEDIIATPQEVPQPRDNLWDQGLMYAQGPLPPSNVGTWYETEVNGVIGSRESLNQSVTGRSHMAILDSLAGHRTTHIIYEENARHNYARSPGQDWRLVRIQTRRS